MRSRQRKPHVGYWLGSLFTGHQNSGLIEEFFGKVGQYRLILAYKVEVRMQAEIFRVNDAQSIPEEIVREPLERRIVMPAGREDYFRDERWLPAPGRYCVTPG